MLIRRIEDGVVPARSVPAPDGVRYRMRAAWVPDGQSRPVVGGALASPPEEADAAGAGHVEVAGRPAGSAERTAAQPHTPEDTPPPIRAVVEVATVPADLDHARDIVEGEPMSTALMDARELVAALLDRFERTLELRLRAENRLQGADEIATRDRRIGQLERDLDRAAQRLAREAGARQQQEATATPEAELRGELERARAELDAARGELETARVEVARRDEEREGLQGERRRLTAVQGHLQQQLEQERQRLAARETELQREAEQVREYIAARRAELERNVQERERQPDEWQRRQAEHDAELAELRARSDRLVERDAALERTRREVASLQADLAAARRAAAERERTDTERERIFALHGRDAAQLRDQLAVQEATVVQLRRELAERDRALADMHVQLMRRDEQIDALQTRDRKGLFRR
jgi:chromosome segregation ATPase